MSRVDRRKFLVGSAGATAATVSLSALASVAAADDGTRQAMGTRVGEVTDTEAIVWTRLTAAATRNNAGVSIVGHVNKKTKVEIPDDWTTLVGACPGQAGRIRVRYGMTKDLSDARETEWARVTEANDFHHQFRLISLKPSTTYYYSVETAGPDAADKHAPTFGQFHTAPPTQSASDVTFCVTTCLMYADLDHEDGFHIYPAMQKLDPNFVVFTGDSVYYDSDLPPAKSPELARYHWQRMYSLPRHVELLRSVATYWEKDDHDTHDNDTWPGYRPLGKFTFDEGVKIYRQQVPIEEPIYRTFRWGKDVQIWLTEGREFRSPNNMKDGPDKTIWGAEQKAWLMNSLLASDARWKIFISPTPIVGPDRKNKNDNHANAGFTHEGNEFRQWAKENLNGNFFVVCGDRHWQYESVHPETGLREFACGPGSDEHASGTPGFNESYHKFHRVKGGFLSVKVRDGAIAVRHHDVHGEIVHEWIA
jgi:alkaline phosphatase D